MFHCLGVERRLFELKVGAVIAGPAREPSPVEIDDPGRQFLKQRAVVGHKEQRAAEGEQELFKPGNGVNVQVVRGLVEEQKVRPACQGPREQDAALEAAGEFGEFCVLGKLQPRQDLLDFLLHLPAPG